jgi:restriction system protein
MRCGSTEIGPVKLKQGARGSEAYLVEVYHEGLHKHRLVRGPDAEVVCDKALAQAAAWNEAWAKRVATERQMTMAERKREEAADRTAEAQRALQALRDVLSSSLPDSKAIDWEALKDRMPFPTAAPAAPKRPTRPEQDPIPEAPSRTSPQYQPEIGLLDKLVKSRRVEKENRKTRIFGL